MPIPRLSEGLAAKMKTRRCRNITAGLIASTASTSSGRKNETHIARPWQMFRRAARGVSGVP